MLRTSETRHYGPVCDVSETGLLGAQRITVKSSQNIVRPPIAKFSILRSLCFSDDTTDKGSMLTPPHRQHGKSSRPGVQKVIVAMLVDKSVKSISASEKRKPSRQGK